MVVKKKVFDEYIKARENSRAASTSIRKSKYTYNKVFDPMDVSEKKTPLEVEKTKDKAPENGRQTVDKRYSQPGTNGRQTVDNFALTTSFPNLCGAQRKIVVAIYKNCKINCCKIARFQSD